MIRFSDVSFGYPQSPPVLKHISLTVKDGDWLTVLGSNGSGKSTLAMLMNGLLRPQEGEVLVDGLSTAAEKALPRIRKSVGMVFQNPDNQIVGATVEEDIAFGPCNLGLPREEIRQRVEMSLEATGMTAFRRHSPHLLSGGQKQKVALAGALAMRPKHLILDEACSMLDPIARDELWSIIRKTREEYGLTVVNISHFPQETLLGNGILLLRNGAVEASLWQSS